MKTNKDKKPNKFIAWFKKPVVKKWLWHIGVTLIVICCTIPLQYGIGQIEMIKDENIFLLFVIAILIILIETKNIIFGIVSSLIFVLSYNFFETEPYFSLAVDDPNYYISFAVFIIVSLIVGSLVIKLQKQNKIAVENGKKVRAMYDLSSRLLDNHDKPFVFNFVINFFSQYLNLEFSIIDMEQNIYGEEVKYEEFKDMMTYCLEKNIVIGKDTFMYKDSNYLVFPIRSKSQDYGVLIVNLTNQNLLDSEIEFIKKNILHLVVVLDREEIIKLQESSKLAIEKEKFKNQLLRSLSHDLKTPLTSIQSGSDLLINSYDKLDDKTKKELIYDIYNQSMELNSFIVNLLNMSKLDSMKKIVNRKKEAVDDILSEVYEKVKPRLKNKKLIIERQEELVLVDTDATLLESVLINLIDNGVKHTKDDTIIKITYAKDETGVTFNVIDNGGGIKKDCLDKIFEDFYSLTSKQDSARSNGLGLSIVKAIVEAHGGSISAKNNNEGGATFTFNIPNESETN